MNNIYFVGAPTEAKGIIDFNYLASKIPEAKFNWYCYRINDETIKKYTYINFIVGLDDRELKHTVSEKMNIFISCSHYEGFCLPIAEAMLMKKPVISYDLEEVVTVYEKNIRYVPLHNKNAYIISLNKLLKEHIPEEVLDKSKQFIEENFSPRVVSNKLLDSLLLP